MAETVINAAAVLGMDLDQQNNSVRLRLRDSQLNAFRIDLPETLLGGLIVSLTQIFPMLRASGVAQPMALIEGRPFKLHDERVGLEVHLDNGLRLPLIFPKEAIPVLHKALEQLEALSKNMKGPTAQ